MAMKWKGTRGGRSRRVVIALGAASAGLVLGGEALAADSTWKGGTGNWTDPAGWAPDPVPDEPADNAIVGSGDVTVDQPLGIGGLTFGGGTIGGTNDLALGGMLNWSGGTFGGAARTLANGGMTLGGFEKRLNDRTLVSTGESTWSAGDLVLGGAGTLVNEGKLTLGYDGAVHRADGASGSFVNRGELVKAGIGQGVTTFNVPFNNSGTVRVSGGVLRFAAGGSSAGHFDVADGNLELGGGY